MGLLVRPKVEWEMIAPEPATTQGLFLGYAAILGAIPAVASIIHGLLPACFFVVCWTNNPIWVVVGGVTYYIAELASVFVIGFIIDALAPSFGGERNQMQAMKVAVYSWTALWVAGVFLIVPWIGGLLSLLGLYSVYQLYTGLPALMKAPPDKSIAYTAVVVVLGLVVVIVVSVLANTVTTIGAISGGAASAPGQLSGTVHLGNGNIDLGKLQQAGQQLQQQVQAAQNGGGPAGGQIVAVDPAKLKALLPDTLAGLPRSDLTSTSAGNQAISAIEATYSSGDQRVKLTITDLAVASPLVAFASALNVQRDEETSTGYDREQTINGRMTVEKYDNQSRSGEYSVVVASRFALEASGSGVPMDTLKAAVNAIGPDRVDALAHGG
jgi:hypothetical protein